jgi:hypothetical protein
MGTTRADSSKEQVKMSAPARRISAGFRERAHYPLAATLTDIPRDAAMFDERAFMFDQIACRFGRAQCLLPPQLNHKAR